MRAIFSLNINLDLAQSARLKAVPDQQILVVTNQVDSTQVATTNFPRCRRS